MNRHGFPPRDGNGYGDDLHGWDFAYADNRPIDRRSRKFPEQFDHGTVLASLMAAVPDNGIGTAGIGRNIKVMNLRVVGEPVVGGDGNGDAASIVGVKSTALATNEARACLLSLLPGETTSIIATTRPSSW